MSHFRLFPPSASTTASQTDTLFAVLCGIALFFTILIATLVIYFAIRYRRRSAVPPPHVPPFLPLEIAWTAIPLIIVMVIYVWSGHIFFYIYNVPAPQAKPIVIHVVGKQWMWKIQHYSTGKREIDELHLPVNRPAVLYLSSQDVIHDFFVPAFRVKEDVVPGRTTVIWFQPTRVGEYYLFCSQYCGTQHSKMIGRVIVMEPRDYEAWLSSGPGMNNALESGRKLYAQLQCNTCHGAYAPTLAGLYGTQVRVWDRDRNQMRTVTADDAYIRESILDSQAKVVEGYGPIMPSYRGQISEEEVNSLTAYIKSLKQPDNQKRAN